MIMLNLIFQGNFTELCSGVNGTNTDKEAAAMNRFLNDFALKIRNEMGTTVSIIVSFSDRMVGDTYNHFTSVKEL